jgi:hypothetical protein
LCNWRRSLRLKHELGRVLDAVLAEEPDLRLVMLTLTVPNPSYDDFGQAIGELKTAVGRLMRYKRIQDAVRHWFRALEVTCPRPRELHPHYHILLLVPPVYFDPDHDLYIEWSEWKALWRRALNADADRIIDIRATDNPNEVAKYVAKPSAYVALTGEEWRCDSLVLETLHYGLASRRMIAWSRSLSEIRRRLGFLELKEGEELIDVGDEDDGLEWEPVRILTYRWRCADGRWSYRLTNICTASWGDDEIEAPWTYYGSG